ncbi:hypothetical protein [Sedimenticola hydrogenitrophicus]|uniref:hypothetical protein n=1 Tax=Sedimenticola hydrogenitrophicus TaxID=2967975 RepID=UPI0021A8CF90|nr:hypothetical protein [Sedimenticola hydrogenitrophicus]
MKNILITGALERSNGFELGDGKYYGCAKLLKLNLESGAVTELLSVAEGNENFPNEHPNLQFTSAYVEKATLWLPMDTEIRKYNYPELKVLQTISHPCFQNIHSVTAIDGFLYATSTGLDTVAVLNKEEGNIVKLINAEGKSTWHRFLADTDYRQVHSTRPHECHPNYVFKANSKIWVTRCTQEDAICLDDFASVIDITGGSGIAVHDGVVLDDKIFFTAVDGCIMIADANQKTVIETLEINKLTEFDGVRGWCRGLLIDDDILYIGFSRLRKTRAKGKLAWVKKLAKRNKNDVFTYASILAFDLKSGKIVADYPLPEESIHAIYSVINEPS